MRTVPSRAAAAALAASLAALLVATLATPAGAQQAAPPLDRANLDTTCSPCQDFYRFANGGWLARNPIPAAYSRWSSFDELTERNNAVLRAVLDTAARRASAGTGGVTTRKLGTFYASCMDSTVAEVAGARPIAAELGRIEAVRSREALQAEIARLHAIGVNVAFDFAAAQDPKNSDRMIADASQGGLGLPDRDFYTRTDARSDSVRRAYVAHVARVFELLGDGADAARADADRVMALETALASASMTRVQLRDPNALYHKTSVAELGALTPAFAWRAYFRRIGLAGIASINVEQPDFFAAVNEALAGRPLEDWRAYLRWRLADRSATWLSADFVNEDFKMRSTLTGARELQPRWRRCLRAADQYMGEALGEEYVKVAFTPAAKAKMLEMVGNLRAVLRERLGTLEWMSDSTRKQALVKLDAFAQKIGYPERWRDYSRLQVVRGPFVTNVMNARRFETQRDLAKVGKPVDRTEWAMTPPTVNAYYNPQINEIVFPAGRLQPPFFDPAADEAANYGGVGGTIGHEMTHGFDDEGRQFDARGNLRDWWTAEDATRFTKRADLVEAQYNAYTVLDTLHVNGKLTLGENIADISGLTIAYYALQKALAGKPRPLVDGFTPEQRFFLAYAQARRATVRPEAMRVMILTDPHSPGEFRVNGPIANMPEFARAFGCNAGDRMVRSDSLRAQIW